MPQCFLSQEFLTYLLRTPPDKIIHYMDKELHGFLLEYRPSGKGTWYFRYRLAKGKTRYHRMGTTQSLCAISAREQAYRIRAIVQNGGDPQQESIMYKPDLTLERFVFERYLPHIQLKKRSWQLDKRVLEKHILPKFGERLLYGIKRIEIMDWLDELRLQGLQPSSCNRMLSVIKTLFSSAVYWGILDVAYNPCKGIRTFFEKIPTTRYLSKNEMLQALCILQEMGDNQKALALQLLIFTGARKSEILNARWEHVHLDERILTVPLAKSGRAHHIPLSDEALKIINILEKGKTSPWLFPGKSGDKPLSSLFDTWNKVRKELKLPKVRIHDLRHSFASMLVTAGSSLYEVQKILGHHNPKVTMRYAHFAQESLVEVANRIGENLQLKSLDTVSKK